MAAFPVRSMQGQATLHSFPTQATPSPRPAIARRTPRYYTEVQSLDSDGARKMLGVTRDLVRQATRLIEYMDQNRHEARMSGVETIAIELSAILEGGKISAIEDALEDAVQTGEPPAISIDGFSKLRRVEFLVGEVDHEIERGSRRPVNEMGWWSPYRAPYSMGAPLSEIPTSLLILGVIGAGAILAVVILALTKRK